MSAEYTKIIVEDLAAVTAACDQANVGPCLDRLLRCITGVVRNDERYMTALYEALRIYTRQAN